MVDEVLINQYYFSVVFYNNSWIIKAIRDNGFEPMKIEDLILAFFQNTQKVRVFQQEE